jgi:hypothetical protein
MNLYGARPREQTVKGYKNVLQCEVKPIKIKKIIECF